MVSLLVGDRKTWYLSKPYTVGYDLDGQRQSLTVPEGAATDFASVPGAFRSLISVIGKHTEAAVVHGYCYASAVLPRQTSDRLFLAGMKAAGVGAVKRWAMYRAGRLFGGLFYQGETDLGEPQDGRPADGP